MKHNYKHEQQVIDNMENITWTIISFPYCTIAAPNKPSVLLLTLFSRNLKLWCNLLVILLGLVAKLLANKHSPLNSTFYNIVRWWAYETFVRNPVRLDTTGVYNKPHILTNKVSVAQS